MHPQLRKSYVPLSWPSLVVIRPSSVNCWSRVVVHSCYRCLIFLLFVKPFYFRMTRRNKLQYLVHLWDWVKVVVFRRSKRQTSFWFCSTLEYYHLYVKSVMRIAPPLMNSWRSDTSRHHYSFLGPVLSQPEYRQVNRDVWNQYSEQLVAW